MILRPFITQFFKLLPCLSNSLFSSLSFKLLFELDPVGVYFSEFHLFLFLTVKLAYTESKFDKPFIRIWPIDLRFSSQIGLFMKINVPSLIGSYQKAYIVVAESLVPRDFLLLQLAFSSLDFASEVDGGPLKVDLTATKARCRAHVKLLCSSAMGWAHINITYESEAVGRGKGLAPPPTSPFGTAYAAPSLVGSQVCARLRPSCFLSPFQDLFPCYS